MSTRSGDSGGDLVAKLALTAVVAVVVGVVSAVSDVGGVFTVVAVLAAVAAFWVLDAAIRPSSDHSLSLAPGAGGAALASTGTLPASVSTQPPLRGVEPPTVGEPVNPGTRPVVADKQTATLDPSLFDPQSVEVSTSSQGTSRVFSLRIAKHGNGIAECEDAVALDPRRGVLAVADGASSSFGAGPWADTLTKQFVQAPPKPLSVASFSEWLGQARHALPAAAGAESDDPNGWWSEHGARQGAFSTIVGAAIMTDGGSRVATVMCLGDSCAFVLTGPRGDRVVRRSLPYEDSEQFGSHPALLGSMADRAHDEPTWTTVPTAPGDLLVLASDAVSEWLLADPRRFQLFDGDGPDEIAGRLIAERTDGKIVNDDLTVAVLELAS